MTQPMLIHNAVYKTISGFAVYEGLDIYCGETTFKFKIDDLTRYVKPESLDHFLRPVKD